MPSKTFDAEELKLVIDGDSESLDLIEDEIIDTTRWSVIHSLVFKDLETGKFYLTSYSTGATEYQDERPFDDDDEYECDEAEPVEVKVITYQKVK